MKFAFLIMGEFDSSKDYASIHENEAQMIGVASIEEARNVARKLQEEGVDCMQKDHRKNMLPVLIMEMEKHTSQEEFSHLVKVFFI